jgi:methionyl-tRNA formyltransferase
MRILFMGTPDFAVSSLEALCGIEGNEITVITQPDKPKGRKYVLTPPEVKVCALERGLDVYQPTTLRGEEFDALLRELDPEMIVVAAYGKILPPSVINYPKYGCINVHGSLLPKYRGAAPIQRAIMEGEKETGITIMYMNEGLDTGDMLAKAVVDITEEDNFESLFDKMSRAGAELLVKTLPLIVNGSIVPEKQDDTLATYAAKIEKDDCRIDPKLPSEELFNVIRGLSPFPLAYLMRGEQMIKLVSVKRSDKRSDKPAGTLICENKGLYMVCGDGMCLEITEVLPAGKKRMSAADYLRGNALEGETVLVKAE